MKKQTRQLFRGEHLTINIQKPKYNKVAMYTVIKEMFNE